MGGSPTPKPDHSGRTGRVTVTQAIAAWPFSLAPDAWLGVALSGGADSTALLVACARYWPGQVVGLHINHGLQSAAADFEAECKRLCAGLHLPLRVLSVQAHPVAGESPEDAARKARYGALVRLCRLEGQPSIADVALAQHADDQVETLLLALSRGSGLPGLAAMPASFVREGIRFHRPLLPVAAREIRQWLTEKGIAWIEDSSNVDTRYTRNRIRARLLPVLEEVFPQFRKTFARSARHAAQASELLQEWACADLQAVGDPPQIRLLQSLSRARQANVLRHWLHATYGEHARPNTAQLDELQAQIKACTTRGHKLHIKVGTGHVIRVDGGLAWQDPT